MKRKERQKQLKKLADSSMGKVLQEEFEDRILNLTDASNFDKDNFEVDGRARVEAAKILRSILTALEMAKKKTKKKDKNQYV